MKVNVELSRDEYKQALINFIHDKNKFAPLVDIEIDYVEVYETIGNDNQVANIEVVFEI